MCKIKGVEIWKRPPESGNLTYSYTVAFVLLLVAGDISRRMKVKG
jgi:hypothetical protein